MTTSLTYAFSPEVQELCDDAFERCGVDPASITARHMRSARRSLNFMFSDWANRGPHLWAVEQAVLPLVAGTATYSAPAGVVAVLEVVVRRDLVDTPVFPMMRDEYLAIPNKTYTGLPNRFWFDRDATQPTITLWNVPENDTDQLVYFYMRQLQDAGAGSNTPDIPYRWQEAIVSGLAAKLAEKYAPDREAALVAKAEARYAIAKQEDRERAPTTTRVKFSVR